MRRVSGRVAALGRRTPASSGSAERVGWDDRFVTWLLHKAVCENLGGARYDGR
jgi:hypothetical protein